MQPEVYNQSLSLTVRAAYLYYIEELPQNEIASLLKVSVPTVSRLIAKAKEEKVIEFVIKDPYLNNLELEQKIKKAFQLKDVVITSSLYHNQIKKNNVLDIEDEKREVAMEGARYIQRIITKKDKLGITYGKTMYHLIHYLNPCKKINAKFITLHGSIAEFDYNLDVMSLVHRMSMAFGGEKKIITSEGFVSNKKLAKALKSEKNIQSIINGFDNVTIAVTGIGSLSSEPKSIVADLFSEEEFNLLKEKNVVADVALRFIDFDGKECDTEIKDRTIGITYEQFKKIPTKIAIVSGKYKKDSLYACLKGQMFDVLITNYELGKAILDLKESEE